MKCGDILPFHEKYLLILKLMAATRLKKIKMGPRKRCKHCKQLNRQHCFKNRHDSVMEITQEHIQKAICERCSLCLPQTQDKAASCKEAIREHDPERLPSSLGQSSFEMDWSEVENCSVVKRNKIWNSFRKSWTTCPLDWRGEGGHLACYLMVWDRTGKLITTNAERYIQVLQQHVLPSRWRLFLGRRC